MTSRRQRATMLCGAFRWYRSFASSTVCRSTTSPFAGNRHRDEVETAQLPITITPFLLHSPLTVSTTLHIGRFRQPGPRRAMKASSRPPATSLVMEHKWPSIINELTLKVGRDGIRFAASPTAIRISGVDMSRMNTAANTRPS